MAANASSAALMLSDIPWNGPIGVIRVGRIDGNFVLNPTVDEVYIDQVTTTCNNCDLFSTMHELYPCCCTFALFVDIIYPRSYSWLIMHVPFVCNLYSLRPLILFANIDVSRHILMVDTSVLAKSNMGRREYHN
jgi:hypothetical protein